MKVVTPEGLRVSWVRAVLMMDDEIARSLSHLYPCTEQVFFTAYCEAHHKAHGEPFAAA